MTILLPARLYYDQRGMMTTLIMKKAKTEDSLDDTETCGLVVKYRKGMTYECVNIWGEGPEVVITGQ